MPDTESTPVGRESRLGALWVVSAVSALVLSLTVSGTLGAWTSAVLDHDSNTAGTLSSARVLQVVGPDSAGSSTTCSSANDPSNTYTCSINLFGSNGVEQSSMAPGSTNITAVTVTNTGDTAGSLKLDAAACDDGTGALCDKLTITVVCAGFTTVLGTPSTLTNFGAASIVTIGTLPAGSSTLCTFTTLLPVLATGWSGQTVAQTVSWSLTA